MRKIAAAGLTAALIVGVNLNPAVADWRDNDGNKYKNHHRGNDSRDNRIAAQNDFNVRVQSTETMIRTGVNAGHIDRAEEQRLRAELHRITNLSNAFGKRAYNPAEMQTLIENLNSLNVRVTAASTRNFHGNGQRAAGSRAERTAVQNDLDVRIGATDTMIRTGVNSGQITAAEEQQLRGELQRIVTLSASFKKRGYTPDEMQNLVNSLNQLNAQITAASAR